MYKIEDIRAIHLEITSYCQAACPMCARNIQGDALNPFMKLDEISIDQFKKWFPTDFIKQLDRLYMCGNLGDPVVAKDTLNIFQYLREINSDIYLSMNTNGSARSKEWWRSLAKNSVSVRFGIDGLEDTHKLYRQNTDFNKVIENAKEFIAAGGKATWDMLIFDHNQNQVESCKKLAEDLGFENFFAKNTSRFKDSKLNVLDKSGKTKYIIWATDRSKEISNKIINQITEVDPIRKNINCKVKEERNLYISATGNVTPCCWTDMEWMPTQNLNRVDYMDQIGIYYNLKNNTLKEIFDSGYFQKIEETWGSCSPLKECSKQCGEVDRFNEQFK